MKLQNPMLVVRDMKRTITFYKEVLGLDVMMDFGDNKILTGGLALQTLSIWENFIEGKPVRFGSNATELYFEEYDFDAFMEKLKKFDITYVHDMKEHAWGQRVIRFYDPDQHIIEVGENMAVVCRRFLHQGMTEEQVAVRMDVPIAFVHICIHSIEEESK